MTRTPDAIVGGYRFYERPCDQSERDLGVIRRAECRPPRTEGVPPFHVRVVCLMKDGSVRCSCGIWGCAEIEAARNYFAAPPLGSASHRGVA